MVSHQRAGPSTPEHRGLTRVPLVVLEHVDLLRELAVALPAFVLLDALVQLHVMAQRVLGLHACGTERVSHTPHAAPAPHTQDRKSVV